MTRRINYFEVLGLKESPEITTLQVKSAYFALAKKYHPDVANSSKCSSYSRAECTRKFREISDAYDVLKNNSRRAHYLAELQSFTYAPSQKYSERQKRSYQYAYGKDNSNYGFSGGGPKGKAHGAQYLDALFHPRTIFIILPGSNKPQHDYSNRAILNGPDKDTAWFNPWKKQWQANAPWVTAKKQSTNSKPSRDLWFVWSVIRFNSSMNT